MKKVILLLISSIPFFAIAQKKNNALEKTGNSITAADLKKHLYVIASEEMGGRDTPSPGLQKAADYIETYFKSLGLKPGNEDSYRQPYSLYRDSVIGATLNINGKIFELNKDFLPSINYSAEMLFSEIVFAGYGIVDEELDCYKELDVRGKAVLIVDGIPATYKPSKEGIENQGNPNGKLIAASKNGAAAVIMIGNNFPRTPFIIPSYWSTNNFHSSVNPLFFTISENTAAFIMGEEAKGIFEKMKSLPLPSKTYKANIDLSYNKKTMTARVSNVMGLLEGTDKKDEYVIISAHYDHLGMSNGSVNFGADDDGSGTVSVLEIAEAFAKAKAEGIGPRRSILFMSVSGEEHGLWGSAFYTNHPVYPLEKTTVDLNIDMVGRIGDEYRKVKDSANYIYVIGDNKLSSDLKPIIGMVNNSYTKLKLDRKYNDPNDPDQIYYRSDHYNFAQKGVPFIFYFNGVHPDYHRPTDTPDKINYLLMQKRARLIFFTAMEIANRDEMLKRDIPLDTQQSY